MARKHLSTNEMLHISATWLDPASSAHQALLAIPDLAASLPRLAAAHEELTQNAQPAPDNPRLEQISTQQADLDHRHDDIIRGIHALLTGIAALLGPEHGTEFLQLRDQLIPEGLASTQKTYAAEAGQAAQLHHRITPEIRALLGKIRLDPHHPGRSLPYYLDEWIALGKQIGDLENEKAHLQPADRRQAALLAARNKWIRAVNLFLAIADAAEISPNTYQLLFAPLLATEQKAAKRATKPPPAPPNHSDPLPQPPSE